MRGIAARLKPHLTGLSARLLVLTIVFVMISEVLIYCPSIARYREGLLEERIAAAHLASLALEVPPDNMVGAELGRQLLEHAGSLGIVLRRPATKALMLSDEMPPEIDAVYDLRQSSFLGLLADAFVTLAGDGSRYLRVIDESPRDPQVVVETVVSEGPIRQAMIKFSVRVLALSVFISLITASLVYFSLQWLFVRPLRGLTQSMVAFRENPEDGSLLVKPGTRNDEIGIAQREFAGMQRGLRDALVQNARLAALGTAVTKINHDLRNILATAQLVSDHLNVSDDPKVRRIAPTLLGAIDRAVALCTRTLRFVREGTTPLELSWFGLRDLVAEAADAAVPSARPSTIDNQIQPEFSLHADREQMFRVFQNLLRNAIEAGATRIMVRAWLESGSVRIDVADNGPGLPALARERLFRPFAGAGRSGGTGLGLSIARDLMRGHGGDIELVRTDADGTVFRLSLPAEPVERSGPPAGIPVLRTRGSERALPPSRGGGASAG